MILIKPTFSLNLQSINSLNIDFQQMDIVYQSACVRRGERLKDASREMCFKWWKSPEKCFINGLHLLFYESIYSFNKGYSQ